MSITEYMVRYILDIRFDGRKNAVAKAFTMHEDIFRRLFRQLSNGHDSPTLLEKALLFCLADDKIDVQTVLDGYIQQRSIHPATMVPCPYLGISERLSVELSYAQVKLKKYKDVSRLLTMSDALLKQIHVVCCGNGTDSFSGCEEYWKWRSEARGDDKIVPACPCQLFGIFLENMIQSLMSE